MIASANVRLGGVVDLDEFWALIDRSRDAQIDQEEALTMLLHGRTSDELQQFHRFFDEQMARAYRWDVWGAGYVLNGGMGDDSFADFCCWLIGRGRDTFEQVLADPDSLADVPGAEPEKTEAEGLWGAAMEAHEDTHGTELPLAEASPKWPAEPAGEEWEDDDLDDLFPRLTAQAKRRWH
jgi:Protein of unknown function (DUF4240)